MYWKWTMVDWNCSAPFLLQPMRSQIPIPQWWHLCSHLSALTGACVPPCVPLVTKSLAWPGGWRTLATSCARLDRAAQPSVSLTSLILGPAHRPAESPEPELCPGSSPPSLSLSLSPSQIQSHFGARALSPAPARQSRLTSYIYI